MSNERLIYLPLGGAGEIGMNAYVYGWGAPDEERLIVVDLGVTFPDMDGSPGVDLIFADVAWLEERADRIEGIFITIRLFCSGVPVSNRRRAVLKLIRVCHR